MNFSIVVPTRGRPDNIKRLLDSIAQTTSMPKKIEVILRLDLDDKPTIDFLKKCVYECKYPFSIKLVIKERNEYISDLWEECLPDAVGDRLFMCADDVIFRTKGWDSIISERTPRADSNVYFIWGNDKNQREKLATLPILSRGWVNLVGYFVPRGYKRDYCDTHLQDIAIRLKKLGHNRMHYFSDVIFEHMHPTCGKAQWDETYKYRLKMGVKDEHPGAHTYSSKERERQETANRLAARLKPTNKVHKVQSKPKKP